MGLHSPSDESAFEGATDASTFEAYVERFLAPTLKERQIVVMDKLGAHRGEKVRELIEARGAQLLVLAFLLARPQPHRRISMKMSSRRADLEGGSVTQHRP